ncbi:MAG TPA: hypothetical protein VIM71_12590 [Lacunisphaera sp.]
MAKGEELPFPSRTARFRQVVDRCGRPDVHLSLVAPARDRALQDLKRRGRVMTVWQAHRGGRTDHGVVGVFPGRGVQFLVFERSLKPFVGKRIVGIDYSLLSRPSGSRAEEPPAARTFSGAVHRTPRARPAVREHSKLKSEAPPVSPPGPVEMKQLLRRLERLLATKHYAAAHRQVRELVGRMDISY